MPQEPTENQQIASESKEKALETLRGIVGKATIVLDNLEKNPGWEAVVSDIAAQKQRLDDTWQFISDDAKLREYRVTKIAVLKILNILDDYRADKKTALDEICKIENPDKVIQKDYQER